MKQKMKVLNDGTEIPAETFGTIFGGGQRKALHVQRKLKVGGEDFFFTIATLDKVQSLIDTYQTEHDRLLKKVAELEAERGAFGLPVRRKRGRPRKNPLPVSQPVEKPRIRVKAGSLSQARFAA